MSDKVIEVNINKEGVTTLTVKGAAGPECRELTRDLEVSLGQPTHTVKMSEWWQSTTEDVGHWLDNQQ